MTPIEERTMRWIIRKPWYRPVLSYRGIHYFAGNWPMPIAIMEATYLRDQQQLTEGHAVGIN